ncbi:response regulator [Algoriphagus formosus]|uniref:response regulator n=1 Tax=Algoriphagus formosus TaxID=2007308 RepID=UPI003F72B4BF
MEETKKDEKIRILYVDDEENNLQAFRATFRRDYKIFIAISGEEGRKILEQEDIEIIITDQRMPEETGVEFLESIIPNYPSPIRVLLTGYTDIQAVIDAINKGQVYHYLTKPWEEDYLRTVIKNAYEVFSLRRENERLTQALIKANEQLEFLLRQNLLS